MTTTLQTLSGRSIIVTGAGQGIGEAIARGLAQAGAHVTVADIQESKAQAVAARITQNGGTAQAVHVDVTQRDSVRALVAAAVQAHGRLDVMFNNAGIAQTKPFLSITEDDWHRVMDVNAMGVLIGIQEAARQMIEQGGGGKIVNTASIAGKQGYEPLAHYSASKFAVVALTQAAARAFGQHRIQVNAICPGVVATDMWQTIDQGFREEGLTQKKDEAFNKFSADILLGRPSVAQDLAGIARYLASGDADYITGQSIMVDGGMVLV